MPVTKWNIQVTKPEDIDVGWSVLDIYSINLTKENLQKYDAVVICTDHDNIDYQLLVDNSKLIIDTRNATAVVNSCNNIKLKDNIVYA